MVVDDHIAIHQLARRILEPEGYMVVAAADAPAARCGSALHRRNMSCCATCTCLVRQGLWLAERIRDSYPTTAIVIATADATLQPAQTFRKGIVGYVLKPFRHDRCSQACGKASAGRRHKEGSERDADPTVGDGSP
jgi:DNA-binding NtrC family response regulator